MKRQKNSYFRIHNRITKLVTPKTRTKIFKVSFLLLVPWLIFFLFYFSFNSYYFGDPTTTYRDAGYEVPTLTQNFVPSFLTIDSDRFEWTKYYSIGFLPDRIKYGLADMFSISDASFTDIIHFRNIQLIDDNWISIF